MRIVLIEPPIVRPRDETRGIECEAPMALMSLAALLRERNHQVMIIDAFAEGYDERKPRGKGYTSIGISFEEIAQKATAFRAEIIGVSSIFYFNVPTVIELVNYLKSAFPEIKIVLGGTVPTMMHGKLMQNKNIDFIVSREGDYVFADLLDHLNDPAKIPGIVWRHGDRVRINSEAPFPDPLDRLPFPARELVDLDLYVRINKPFGYVKENKKFTTILTSRGCPFSCTFCSARTIHGRKIRYRSSENVLSEIEVLVSRFGITELHIIDENFSLDKPRAMRIMNGLIQRGYHQFLSWTCPNGLFINSLDEEVIDKMQESNCHSVALAIESGDPFVSKNLVKKPIDFRHVRKVVKHFQNNTDILLCGYFVIGFPGETKEQIIHTLSFANELQLDNASIMILMPYPFTEVYDLAIRNRQLVPDEDENYFYNLLPKHGVIRTREFTPEWLAAIQETDRFLALWRKKRKRLSVLCKELMARNGWASPRVAGMTLYHALKGDLAGRNTR